MRQAPSPFVRNKEFPKKKPPEVGDRLRPAPPSFPGGKSRKVPYRSRKKKGKVFFWIRT